MAFCVFFVRVLRKRIDGRHPMDTKSAGVARLPGSIGALECLLATQQQRLPGIKVKSQTVQGGVWNPKCTDEWSRISKTFTVNSEEQTQKIHLLNVTMLSVWIGWVGSHSSMHTIATGEVATRDPRYRISQERNWEKRKNASLGETLLFWTQHYFQKYILQLIVMSQWSTAGRHGGFQKKGGIKNKDGVNEMRAGIKVCK